MSNTGINNSGNDNSGNRNSGNRNSGYRNSGNGNSGDRNSGYRNSGNRNSGNWNSGNWNSGISNSGYRNSGDYNSGNYNSGNYNSGHFNTDEPTIRMFNKDTGLKRCDINLPYIFLDLSGKTYHDAWKIKWNELDESTKDRFKNLPNFCPKIFKEITGIDLTESNKNAKIKERIEELENELKKFKRELNK